MDEVVCYKCLKVTKSEKIGFRQSCESCYEDLHVCYNCKFYDPGSYNECKETSADRITVKDRSNLCDFFSPKNTTSKTNQVDEKADLLAQAEALFGKKPSE